MAESKDDLPASTELMRKLGAFALGAKTMPQAAFLAMLGMDNVDLPWPESFACTTVDTATGFRRVLIVAVMAGGATDERVAMMARRLAREQSVIAAAGGQSELIVPNTASLAAFGPNLMDGSRRAEVARAGLEQGREEAGRLRNFWSA